MRFLLSLLSVIVLTVAVIYTNCSETKDETDFLLMTVATNETDGFKRFVKSANKYDIQYKVLGRGLKWVGGSMDKPGGGFKVNLLKEELNRIHESSLDLDSLLIIFTDAYDVMIISDLSEIKSKFSLMGCGILFSAEVYCWPDSKLASDYPPTHHPYRYLNSGGFIAQFHALHDLIKDRHIADSDDDQLFYTKLFLDKELREKYRIKLDNKAVIFQNLHGAAADISLVEKEGGIRILNTRTTTHPCIVHGNGLSKVHLNSLANYLDNEGWHPSQKSDGSIEEKADVVDAKSGNEPIILMGLFITLKTPFLQEFFDSIARINYPKNKIHLYIYNQIDYHRGLVEEYLRNFGQDYLSVKQVKPEDEIPEYEGRNFAVERCIDKSCGYLFAVDSVAQLDSPLVLHYLIQKNKAVIGPMLVRPYKAWSNFWGALNNEGFYARSFDYMDLVNQEKRGTWNVPYLTHTYLINSTLLPHLLNVYKHPTLDPDMAFCLALRNKDTHIFVDNIRDHGHLVDAENYSTQVKHPEFYQLLSNRWDWERRYLHVNYSVNLNSTPAQPCPDVYWFPIVNPRFCTELIDIMENNNQWSSGSNYDKRLTGGYENVPTRDIHMKQVGLDPLWLEFLRLYIRPLQEYVFTGYYHDPPVSLMNFVVRYRPDEQPSLRPHHDSSTYTINIALNRPQIDYQGGGCRFIRYNCSVTDTRLGWLLLHPGRLTHYHEGLKVISGTRYIMISFVDP